MFLVFTGTYQLIGVLFRHRLRKYEPHRGLVALNYPVRSAREGAVTQDAVLGLRLHPSSLA